MRKRILGLLLTLCMVLSVLPLPAFAADADPTYSVTINGGENGTLLKDGTAVEGNSVTIQVAKNGEIPNSYTIAPNDGYSFQELETITSAVAIDVQAGNNHTVVLMSNGTVWACGNNQYGQLGDGTTENRNNYVQMQDANGPITNVTAIAAGGYHTVALKEDGTVWACGYNKSAQLGIDSTYDSSIFVRMHDRTSYISNAKAIAAGDLHTVVLKKDGSVWACGSNSRRQLGISTSDPTCYHLTQTKQEGTPGAYPTIADVTAIAAGGYHTVVLKSDGTVWACGQTTDGQLGIGSTTGSSKAAFVQTAEGITGVTAIAAGGSHTLLLTSDGYVYACGDNTYGQLGLGFVSNSSTYTFTKAHINNVTAIAAGSYHTVVLLNGDDGILACGQNSYYQLGDNLQCLAPDGKFYQTLPISSDYTAITAGGSHTVALKKDGTVWACGNNEYGQAGIGSSGSGSRLTLLYKSGSSVFDSVVTVDTAVSLADITITNTTTITAQYLKVETVTISGGDDGVLMKDGAAVSGNSVTLQIPVGEKLPDGYTFAPKEGYDFDVLERKTQASIINVSAGESHTVVLMSNGTVWACGNNSYGQSGGETKNDVTRFVQMKDSDGFISDATAVSAGSGYTVILRKDGTVWACGRNDYGQLSNNSKKDSSTFVQMQYNSDSGTAAVTDVAAIAAGRSHTVVLKKDGTVWACGLNDHGQLGDSSTVSRTTLVPMQDSSSSAMKDVTAIAVGTSHTVILKKDGTVWACGYNALGQLGNNSTTDSSTFVQMQYRSGYSTTAAVTDATAIAAGSYHTVILRDGAAWACGSNNFYQLGNGSQTVTSSSTLVQMKDNNGSITDATAIAAGSNHTVVLRAGGTAWACGNGNTYGQLGLGSTGSTPYLFPMKDSTGSTIANATAIAAGTYHTIVLRTDGMLWACGQNYDGQLGNGKSGNNNNRNISTLVLSGEGVLDSVYTITTADSLSDITVDDNMALTAQWYMVGDVTGNKTVDIRDLVRLKRYLADQSTDIHQKGTDLIKDSKIDKDDLAALKKMLVK